MSRFKNRLRLMSFGILLIAFLLIGKLYLVQIVSGENLRAQAEHQYVASSNYFNRGSIFFTAKDGGEMPAATVKSGFILHINPEILSEKNDLEKIYDLINKIVSLEKSEFLAKASKKKDPYEELAKHLDQEQAKKIEALKITGLGIASEHWRIYPGENTAAHTIGLIGYSGNELAGRYGLERYYEATLKRNREDAFVNFFAEIFSNIKSAVKNDDSLEGDIVTTIEPTVETFLENEIGEVTEKYSSDFTGGIVIDPKTGEIFAMALSPSFDPNLPQREKSADVFRNRLIEDRYEMGSILKAVTMAIGIDAKSVTAKTVYDDPGCMTLNTRTFCNYDGKSHGLNLSMQIVLNKSLNTGATYIVLKMGAKKFSERMQEFGLSDLTDIDLPNEGKSLVSNLKTGKDLEMAQASFGQGIALTPIMTVRTLSALANGGTLITPHLVKKISYKIGTTKIIPFSSEADRKRVLSPEASKEISRMLTEVVDRSLQNGGARLEKYNVAAKTGTAQIARPDRAGYYDDRYLHSFFGYFPSYEPRFLVFLYTYHPKGVQYASETLTDSFMNITKFLINYYNIPPDRDSVPRASI